MRLIHFQETQLTKQTEKPVFYADVEDYNLLRVKYGEADGSYNSLCAASLTFTTLKRKVVSLYLYSHLLRLNI